MGIRQYVAAASVVAGVAINWKRGFVADGCRGSSCQDVFLLNNTGWYYDYNAADPFAGSNSPMESIRFAPMNWCLDDMNTTVPAGVNTTFFMGFNEPNNAHNCNTDAQTVAQAWATFIAKHPGSTYVSPATAGNGISWFQDFFAACNTLYGPSGCTMSYIAVHDYSCNASSTMAYLQQVYSTFQLPVWLTEFSCGDGSQRRPTSDQLTYMKSILPLLDAAPYVYRYSWMSAHDGNNLRGLITTDASGQQTLTQLGQLYNSL